MLDQRLKRSLPEGLEAKTVRECGWSGKKNGELLGLAAREFDAFLTTDRGIPHEQNLSNYDLTVLILRAKSNSIEDLGPLMEKTPPLLRTARPGEALFVET